MSVVQVTFDIPPEIQQGLNNGTLIRFGGIIRDTAGHIVAHLPEISDQISDSAIKKVEAFFKRNKNPIIIITVVATAFTVAGISYVVVKNKNKEDEKIPKYVIEFNEAFTKYMNQIKNGNLTEDTVDILLSSINSLNQNENSGNITITIPIENSGVLINMVKSYTEKFQALTVPLENCSSGE